MRAQIRCANTLLADRPSTCEGVVALPTSTATGPPRKAYGYSARSASQLESSELSVSVGLDADTLTALDQLGPGPGEAPQAYAW